MVLPLVPLVIAGAMAAGGTAAALRGMGQKGQTPNAQYYGGSQEAQRDILHGYRSRQDQSIEAQNAGLAQMGQGVQSAQGIAEQGRDVYGLGSGAFTTGRNAAGAGLAGLSGATNLAAQAAYGNAPSEAEILIRNQAAQIGRQQAAMAANVRGGNQAAAMMGAQQAGAEAQLAAVGQAAALRANEMAANRQAYAQAAAAQTQAALGMGSMGLGAMGQGMGAQQFGAQSQMGYGQFGAELGAQREGAYLGAEQQMLGETYRGAIAQEQARAAANQRKADRWLGFGSSLLGGAGRVMGSAGGGGG